MSTSSEQTAGVNPSVCLLFLHRIAYGSWITAYEHKRIPQRNIHVHADTPVPHFALQPQTGGKKSSTSQTTLKTNPVYIGAHTMVHNILLEINSNAAWPLLSACCPKEPELSLVPQAHIYQMILCIINN